MSRRLTGSALAICTFLLPALVVANGRAQAMRIHTSPGAAQVHAADEGRSALDGTPAAEGISALQVPAEFGGRPLVTESFVEHAHAHDIHVHVWTINEPAEIERLFDLGVDGIVSDFPGRVAAAAAARRGDG